jgi:hypothetical protein
VILITARAAGPGQAANREFIGDAEPTISVFVLAALAFWNAPAAFRSPFSSTVQKTEHRSVPNRPDHSCGPHTRTLLVKPAPASTPCGDRHPLLRESVPGNSAILPAETASVRPGLGEALTPTADRYRAGRTRRAPESAASKLFQSASALSTVLRS